ncbi:MAG TPA: aldolase/citrate lyase family protein, partial [Thermoanaerobaculia bacterium]|nr:aldolase/citrate lyase family protein [Thermoanaerobaculia bacterium]
MSPSLRARLREGETLLGGFVTWAEGGLVELLAHAGFDLAVLDCEHGLSGAAAVENLVRAGDAAGIAAIVRAPSPGSDLVGRFLDAGAEGILFPRVRSAEDAARAAESARYAPLGTRGLGAARANRYATRPLGDFVK